MVTSLVLIGVDCWRVRLRDIRATRPRGPGTSLGRGCRVEGRGAWGIMSEPTAWRWAQGCRRVGTAWLDPSRALQVSRFGTLQLAATSWKAKDKKPYPRLSAASPVGRTIRHRDCATRWAHESEGCVAALQGPWSVPPARPGRMPTSRVRWASWAGVGL